MRIEILCIIGCSSLFSAQVSAASVEENLARECRETVASIHEKIILPQSVSRQTSRPPRQSDRVRDGEQSLTNLGSLLREISQLKDAYCGFRRQAELNRSRNAQLGGGAEAFSAATAVAEDGKNKIWKDLCAKRKEFVDFEVARKLNDLRKFCTRGKSPAISERDLFDMKSELIRLGGMDRADVRISIQSDKRFLKKVELICKQPRQNPCSAGR